VSLDGLPPAHLRVLLDGLPVFERYGLQLAGGYAFILPLAMHTMLLAIHNLAAVLSRYAAVAPAAGSIAGRPSAGELR
jgi:hypothetical protein